MAKIILAFTAAMQTAIKDGRKCCTSRTHKKGDPGDIFIIDGQTFRLTHILQMYADSVAKELYGAEGFSSPGGFIDWYARNKGMFDPEQVLYVHFFAAVLPVQAAGFAPAVRA